MRNRLTLNAIRNYEWAPTERQPGGHCLDCETLAFNPLRVYDTYLRIFHYDERRDDRPIGDIPFTDEMAPRSRIVDMYQTTKK